MTRTLVLTGKIGPAFDRPDITVMLGSDVTRSVSSTSTSAPVDGVRYFARAYGDQPWEVRASILLDADCNCTNPYCQV